MRNWLAVIFFFSTYQTFANDGDWRVKMSELAAAVNEASPLIFKNIDEKSDLVPLREAVGKIYNITKVLDQGFSHAVRPDDPDPTIRIVAQKFRSDVDLAQESLRRGDISFPKQIMRGSIAYCVACHTRSSTGPHFPMVSAFKKNIENLSLPERVSLQTATRQFDTAFDEVLKMLAKPIKISMKPLEVEKATRTALSIAVRVNENPEHVIKLANAVKQSIHSSASLKRDAEVWARDASDWKAEKKISDGSDTELLTAARALINRKEELNLTTWIPHAEVRYLRASNLMHTLLRKYPKSKDAGEALYIIGISYDVLRDLGLWSLHESYYVECIQKAPHSKVSAQCFQRYEDSVVAGFTGSAGTSIPEAIRDHLRELKKQAQ